jgi:hypothetical protein
MISSQHGQMIQGLLDEPTIRFYTSCSIDLNQANRKLVSQLACTLDITVYGPFELFELIGPWFQDYDVYLQDPNTCAMNARYCNPQKLSSGCINSSPFLSEIVARSSSLVLPRNAVERPDLLDILSSQEILEEAPQPAVVRSPMHRHQRQALTFMLRREAGWAFDGSTPDMWEQTDTSTGRCFVNRISETHQTDPPPEFCGGIIADPMGLGKTLTMIALAANDLQSPTYLQSPTNMNDNRFDGDIVQTAVRATLIIVPQPLLSTWEEQLNEHIFDGFMMVCRHHGKSRISNINDVDAFNIVLTTYHTLSADWKAWKAGTNSVMYSMRWKRIILDEGNVPYNSMTLHAQTNQLVSSYYSKYEVSYGTFGMRT